MASTYSDRLKLELMETGANANTWGNNTNTNLETLDAFSGGYLSKSVAGSANVTLTTNNADPTAEASNKVIELTGALTGDIHVFIPAVESNYLIYNNTSGSQSVTVAATGHAANGTVITQSAWHWVYCDGASNYNVTEAAFTTVNASLLSEGTLADARLTANVTLNNASTISAGTLADARLTANVTLNNASTISAGTLSNDRLDTVPTSKGGTGLTSVGSAGQVLTVTSPGTGLEYTTIEGGGGSETTTFTSPGTWTKDAGLKAVRVHVVGGGGNGGANYPNHPGGGGGGAGYAMRTVQAPSIPGPQPVTVGGAGSASSFGGFATANGGSAGNAGQAQGNGTGGPGGGGSGGDLNISGGPGGSQRGVTYGGASAGPFNAGLAFQSGAPGKGKGGGAVNGGSGASGVVVVEEYY